MDGDFRDIQFYSGKVRVKFIPIFFTKICFSFGNKEQTPYKVTHKMKFLKAVFFLVGVGGFWNITEFYSWKVGVKFIRIFLAKIYFSLGIQK